MGTLLSALASGSMRADTVPLGRVSFDTYLPSGPGQYEIDGFAIENLTGNWSPHPGFPVADENLFLNSHFLINFQDGSQEMLSLGDLTPDTGNVDQFPAGWAGGHRRYLYGDPLSDHLPVRKRFHFSSCRLRA
jgi:hypothetical protein